MKRFELLLDTNPPRSAYADADRIEKEGDEWVIYRGDEVVARYKVARVLGYSMIEIEEGL